jgi:hypothetical protein
VFQKFVGSRALDRIHCMGVLEAKCENAGVRTVISLPNVKVQNTVLCPLIEEHEVRFRPNENCGGGGISCV